MSELKLFMVMLGCKPAGRHTEQHDIFFSISKSLEALVRQISSWKEAEGNIHIDAWRKVTLIDNYSIIITEKNAAETSTIKEK